MSNLEPGFPKSRNEGLKAEDVIERLAPPHKVDWETGLYTGEVLLEELNKFITSADEKLGLYATGITIEDLENHPDKNEALRNLGAALLNSRDLLRNIDLPTRIGENSFVVIKTYRKSETGDLQADLKEELSTFVEQEDRIRTATGILVKKLPLLKWNNSFYQVGDTPETFIERADPYGSYMDLTRAHSQGAEDYEEMKNKAVKVISMRNIRLAS